MEGEPKSYWTVHPKSAACDKCQAMGSLKFAEKPERPHLNCKCEMRQHEGVAESHVDCSHLIEIALPGLGTTLLDRDFAQRVEVWKSLNRKSGINLTFSEGFRTNKQQKGMSENPYATTPAKAGTSLHEAGRAVDANVNRWKEKGQLSLIVENANSVGISWGGYFSTADIPHFYAEVPGGRGNRSQYIRIAQQCAKQGSR